MLDASDDMNRIFKLVTSSIKALEESQKGMVKREKSRCQIFSRVDERDGFTNSLGETGVMLLRYRSDHDSWGISFSYKV